MPYIAESDRLPLDPFIDRLATQIVERAGAAGGDAAYAGLLNYTCTRPAMQIIKLKFGKLRYWIIVATTGVFHNIADEFYRRMAVPYEDVQIEKNGDVDTAEISRQLPLSFQDPKFREASVLVAGALRTLVRGD